MKENAFTNIIGQHIEGIKFGKDRSRKARFWGRKSLLSAGLGVFCLLVGCARTEPGQAGYGAGDLEGVSSPGTRTEATAAPLDGENPQAESGNTASQAGENLQAGTSGEGNPAGGAEQAVLTDILYDKKQLEASKSITIQFLFSDGDSVERTLDDTFGKVYYLYIDHDDMTGDGTEEVVIHRFTDVAGERYSVLDIFQVEGKEIRQLFPTDGIEGLEGNVCDEDVFLVDRNGRKGYGLHVKLYHEGNGPDKAEEMDLFFEDGRWIRLPERELYVEVSLESDSPEARLYEAFLKGECEAALSGQYFSETSYRASAPTGQESFSFQDMLDTMISGIVEDRATDGMERVECALIDCGSDGRPELAVRAYGVSIDCGRDDSEAVMIFRCRDGRVELIYTVDSWSRSDTDIYPDGYVTGWGSGGAMTQYEWDGIIGADGVYRGYSVYIEWSGGLYGMTGYKPIGEERLPADFYECTLGDETMYGYYIEEDIPEDVRENVMKYIAENEEKMGVKFLPDEEMNRQLDRWAENLGITEEMRERVSGDAEGIPWQTVGGCEDYLYGQHQKVAVLQAGLKGIVCPHLFAILSGRYLHRFQKGAVKT